MPRNYGLEAISVKSFFESLSERGYNSKPLFSAFRNGERLAGIMCREIKGVTDKEAAFKELFSIIPSLHADEVFFAADSATYNNDTDVLGNNIVDWAKVTNTNKRIQLFQCLFMQKGNDFAVQQTLPYIKDKQGMIYYVMNDGLGEDAKVSEGAVIDLLKQAFEMENSAFSSVDEHAKTLSDFGHAVAIFPHGDRGDFKLY